MHSNNNIMTIFVIFNGLLNSYVLGTYISMSCVDDSTWVTGWDADWAFWKTSGGFPYFMGGISSYHDNGREDRRFQFGYCQPSLSAYKLIYFMKELPTGSVTTAWDGEWTLECESNNEKSAIMSLYSRHDNGREDRVFRAECAALEGLTLQSCSWSNYVNNWDDPFSYDCPNNGVIAGIYSRHDNGREDRRYKIKCCRFWDS